MSERRRFLRVLGAAAFGAAVPGCGDGESSTPRGADKGGAGGAGGGADGVGGAGGVACNRLPPGVAVGPAASFDSDGLHKVPDTSVLIGRDAGGFYALSSICTHKACNLNKQGAVFANGIRCACHGSRFDLGGQVLNGPAAKPLVAYALAVDCDGVLFADTQAIVANTDRIVV